MHLGVLYPPFSQRSLRDQAALRSNCLGSTPIPPARRPSRAPTPRLKFHSISASSNQSPNTTSSTSPSPNAASTSENNPNTSAVFPDPSQKRAEITANVERAATMVGEIVDEVTREMFLSEAVAYLQADRPDTSELNAVRTAVERRLDFLDANFLTALSAFAAAADRRGDAPLASLLATIRAEVLRQVAARMPAAAQVLDLALREVDKDARLAILRAAVYAANMAPTPSTPLEAPLGAAIPPISATGPNATGVAGLNAAGTLPPAELDTLAATASKFIDEMEEAPTVLDRPLLARLVLVREELRALREELRFNDPFMLPAEPVRSNVPQRCAAFLKELLPVREPLRRIGLMAAAFEADWEGAAPRQKPATAFHAGQPDWVRPGRFMATLQTLVVQVSEGPDPEANVGLLARLGEIREEALTVLDRMQMKGSGREVAEEGKVGGEEGGLEEE